MAAEANGISVTTSLADWQFKDSFVERQMDSSAYEAAHPDDTLVLAGPPRRASIDAAATTDKVNSLLPVGMLQAFSISSSKPTQPLMAIGSSRSFFVSGKSQTQWNIGRLFVNGNNLLRTLAHNYMAGGGDPSAFDDIAATSKGSSFFVNLDSELFYIPFGLAVLLRNKAHKFLGALYVELSMVNSYSLGITAGQSMILENVSGVCDRVLPWSVTDTMAENAGLSKATMDTIMNFTEPV